MPKPVKWYAQRVAAPRLQVAQMALGRKALNREAPSRVFKAFFDAPAGRLWQLVVRVRQ